MKQPINVIIVDDHQMFIDGIKSFLESAPNIKVIGEATTGKKVLEILEIQLPDLIILDVHLPEMDGEAILDIIEDKYPKIKVLVVTMSDKDTDIQRMLYNGADGYLLKDKGKEELVNAIYQVYAGKRYIPLDLVYKAIPASKKKAVRFTSRECEVLKLIMQGLGDKLIAKKLNIAPVTVETHCRNMRKKTQTSNRIQLSNYARKHGLCH